MNYKKVKQTELEGLTQKEGEDLLFAAGYVKDDDYSDRDDCFWILLELGILVTPRS